MKNNPLFWCFLSAFFSGVWPLVAKFSKLNASWMALIVPISTIIVTASWLAINPQPMPQAKPVLITFVAGLIGAAGLISYSKLISWPAEDISKLVPIATSLTLIILAFGAWLVFGDSFNAKKILGLAAILLGIYLIR